ncbi:hypothetical protein CCP3SC1AL1_400015 [Gammaproteobacteria bacterium]
MKIFNFPSRMGCCDPVSAVIGGAAMLGSAAISKPKKVSAPPPRNYLKEMQTALNAQAAIQPQLLALERQYTPQYQQLQEETLMGQMGSLGSLYGEAGRLSQGLQAQYAGMQMPIYGAVGEMARGAYQQGLGAETMGLYNLMQQQAQQGLEAGYGLTPEMQRQAQQSARAAMTARGLAGGGQGVAAEVLNSYALGQQRYQQSLQNAQSAYGLGTQQFATGMGAYGTPLMAQLNQVSPSALIGTSGGMASSLGAKIFQPESQYSAGVYGANQANEMNARMANAQAQAGWSSGVMGMIGSVGAGMLANPGLFAGSAMNTSVVPRTLSVPFQSNTINQFGSLGTNQGILGTNVRVGG